MSTTPEVDPLEFLESANAMTDALASLRNQLVDKGWSSLGAEQAAMQIVGIVMMQQGQK